MKIITRFWQYFWLILFIVAVLLTAALMFLGKVSNLDSFTPVRLEDRVYLTEKGELEQLDSTNKIDRPGIERFPFLHKTEIKSEIKYKNIRIIPPVLIKQIDPEYPKEAQEKGIQGRVIFEAEIDAEGRIKEVIILKSIHPLFISPSLKAIRQWIYHPMLLDGRPCECTATITCNFKLTKVSKKIPVITWRGIL